MKIQILEHHLDSFGHVNNATYMEIYEQARWDLITKNNYGLDTIQKLKIGPVILEATIKYKKELKNREWITVESTSLPHRHSKIAIMKQIMKKSDGTVASEGIFTVGLMDLIERKLVEPTPEWKAAINFEY